ncbi:MAG: transcription-repair coupling factor [Caldicoprobacterales bacterium]|jgi:transcription-repair coupling factor (superfamily II helicase)
MNPIWLKPMERWPQFQKIRESVQTMKGITSFTGVIDAQKCHLTASMLYPWDRTCIFITYDELQANRLLDDMRLFCPDRLVLFPAGEIMLYHAAAHSREVTGRRLSVLERLAAGEKLVVITSVDALLQPSLPFSVFSDSMLEVVEGEEYSLTDLAAKAIQLGYDRIDTIEGPGQFCVRGSIFDIFPLTAEKPYRIDFFDEFVDSIRTFDLMSQRSENRLASVRIPPARDLILTAEQLEEGKAGIEKSFHRLMQKMRKDEGFDKAHLQSRMDSLLEQMDHGVLEDRLVNFYPFFFEKPGSLLDYAGREAVVVLDEPVRIREHSNRTAEEFAEHFRDLLMKGEVLPEQAALLGSYDAFLADMDNYRGMALLSLPRSNLGFEPRRIYPIAARSIPAYLGKWELLAEDLRYWKQHDYSILLLSGSRSKAEGLADGLMEAGLEAVIRSDARGEIAKGQIVIAPGSLSKGFEYTEGRFVLVGDKDIHGTQKRSTRAKKRKRKLDPFTDLKTGSLVVHENHGIGKYLGIEKLTVNGQERDYLLIRYAGTDRLYIPTDQMDLIQPYIGMDEKAPRLSKLGGSEWQKARSRVRESVKELAFDLLKLYAAREAVRGYAFSQDSPWQRQFEDSFPYEETPDQLQSLSEIKKDMESSKVMDRLLCGDVGYGKTEVAIRAAFKAVMDGKQVAVLAPTTILAQQHYHTFVSRFGDFPFAIQVLSRFRTQKEQKEIIKALKEGNVDVIIGTHRLLSKDVKFRDLGLLIIDEEQRFGVGHKEIIKVMKKNVDVLTLTATPIPRTLHMSLVGIRDISVIETPPEDRFPVQTYVVEYSDSLVRDAIIREVQRGGQVYFVYNHVKLMEKMAERLRRLVPEVRIAAAHGQMGESALEKVMVSFYQHEYDLLLCSTIIENGLDIPSVNTLIVYDADYYGLSQLYQLRGRVGRSNRAAYAYLTYKRDKILNETAEKRLQAIKEFTEFGSGFKIAMRDLEIRGAGNLLGAEQHGQMAAVGYDLYCKMLAEAVQEMKGEEITRPVETTVDFKADAFIDSNYITGESHRLQMYKRIAAIESLDDKYDVEDEMIDRFGDIPGPAQNLIQIAYIRALAGQLGFTELIHKGKEVRMKLRDSRALAPRALMIVVNENRKTLRLVGSNPPALILHAKDDTGTEAMQAAQKILETINDLQGSEIPV